MLGGEPAHRASYRPSTCWSSSGSRRQLRPVSTTGTSSGPGVQSTGSPTGWPNSFTVLTRMRLDRGSRGDGAGKASGQDSSHDYSSHRTGPHPQLGPRPGAGPRTRARTPLAGQPGRPTGVAAGRRRCHRRSAGPGASRRTHPRRGRGRPARHRVRTRPHRHAVRPVLRLRHRRLPAGRAGVRLVGERVGPEHRAAEGHPGRRGGRGGRRRLVPGAPGSAGRERRRLRDRRDDGELHRVWRPAGTRC